ncbi:MAG: LysM peptidoglycan-binding domain-containing protein [Actinomycetota bacterium]|nr:LysM peptidoglycan-binding domain-containing protein [Actinomycetota bacterium]
MSVAIEFAPSLTIPVAARALAAVPTGRLVEQPDDLRVGKLASVTVLMPPADSSALPLRLTRRGVVVVSLAVSVLGAVLVWLAAWSAPADVAAPAHGPAVVTVAPGDTLWSIAGRVAPGHDPRAEVTHLQQLNGLDSVGLVPGQQVRVR